MTKVFEADTRLAAWLDASSYLLARGRDLNLILSVSAPASEGRRALTARRKVDRLYVSEGEYPIHTIAETIFPGWEYKRRGFKGLYGMYDKEYQLLRKGSPGQWGTYADRILHRRTASGEDARPLGTLIKKMRDELKVRSTHRACYELGIAECEYETPVYNVGSDQSRRMGLPCLSHLSFKLYEGNVHLTALYRSHDYRYKVLGNLLGLARLQACVAREVGVNIGTLVVHSTYAYLDPRAGRGLFKDLISDLRKNT